MNAPHIPTPEAGDTPDNKTPSFSPSARESPSKLPKPFACKVYVYEGALRGGQFDRKLWVVL